MVKTNWQRKKSEVSDGFKSKYVDTKWLMGLLTRRLLERGGGERNKPNIDLVKA